MGDLGIAEHKPKVVHVFVTGAGPWRTHTRNPANMIASALPAELEERGASNVDIKIHASPAPWTVSYTWVRENIPPMLFPPKPNPVASSPEAASLNNGHGQGSFKTQPNYDIVLFLGMAGGRKFYTLETQGHRDGYGAPDGENRFLEDADYWARAGAPEVLPTSFDTDTLHQIWKNNVSADIDVRPSNDAGHYLCDYIYYTGLFEYWKQAGKDIKGKRPCMFLHVPGETEDADIERGVIAAEGLIRAMASCWAEEQH